MLQITPEASNVWQLRVTITKTATTSPDNRIFIPSFDTGKTYNSQFIAVGITVKNSKDNWRNGGYLSQEFDFPAIGYKHHRKAFNKTEDLLINEVSILNLPPLANSAYRLRYFPPIYFRDVKLQIWEYIGLQTDLLVRDLANFFANAPADLLINLPEINQKLDAICLKLGINGNPREPTAEEIMFFLFN